jgi:7-carboxy-7-deazaguanine synthase
MKICEIFTSIQGESSYAGFPCTFIRLTGCNLRCTYCDTTYAYADGTEYSEDEVRGAVTDAGVSLVEITGGEPLLQREVYHLITLLADSGYAVLVETNGSMDIRGIDSRAVVILDMKTPGSGMSGEMDFSNLGSVKQNDEVKFVLTGKDDYVWAKEIMSNYGLQKKCRVLFSPAYGILPPAILAEWICADRLNVRLNLQLHNYIFGPGRKGV